MPAGLPLSEAAEIVDAVIEAVAERLWRACR